MSGSKRRSKAILYLVGAWLTLCDQGDAFQSGELYGWLPFEVALDYLTPFVVATYLGLLSRVGERCEEKPCSRAPRPTKTTSTTVGKGTTRRCRSSTVRGAG